MGGSPQPTEYDWMGDSLSDFLLDVLGSDPSMLPGGLAPMHNPSAADRYLVYGLMMLGIKKVGAVTFAGHMLRVGLGGAWGAVDYVAHAEDNFTREGLAGAALAGAATSFAAIRIKLAKPWHYAAYPAGYVAHNQNIKRFGYRWVPSQIPDINDPEAWLR